MEIKKRRDAAEAGENKYYTGRPCTNGHDSPRYTSSGICCKCNSEGVKNYNKRMRTAKNSHKAGFFSYPAHPDDHAALLAYAQALDLQRGRPPHIPTPAAAPAHVDIAEARRAAFGRAVDLADATPADYLPKP